MNYSFSSLRKILDPFFLYIFIFAFSVVSLTSATIFFLKKNHDLSLLKEKIDELHQMTLYSQKEKEKIASLLTQIQEADHFYLDKHVENITFLEPEIKKLQTLLTSDQEKEEKMKRLHFLQKENQILFAEETIRYEGDIQEIEEKQQKPVEMNEDDVRKILCFIEGVPISPYEIQGKRPLLFISDFQLIKKSLSNKENVFIINMNLVKREKKLNH